MMIPFLSRIFDRRERRYWCEGVAWIQKPLDAEQFSRALQIAHEVAKEASEATGGLIGALTRKGRIGEFLDALIVPARGYDKMISGYEYGSPCPMAAKQLNKMLMEDVMDVMQFFFTQNRRSAQLLVITAMGIKK